MHPVKLPLEHSPGPWAVGLCDCGCKNAQARDAAGTLRLILGKAELLADHDIRLAGLAPGLLAAARLLAAGLHSAHEYVRQGPMPAAAVAAAVFGVEPQPGEGGTGDAVLSLLLADQPRLLALAAMLAPTPEPTR